VNVRIVALLTLLLALVAIPARAFTPPPITGHVTDTAGKLSETQRLALDRKLEDYRLRTSNQIAVFIPKSLEGEPIEDVAVDTGRAWKVGVKHEDNGVLLVVAPVERKAWIATGKGAEGALTDLEANDIVRQKMRPHLMPGHEDYDAAVEDATDAIMSALDRGGLGGAPPKPKPATPGDIFFGLVLLAIIVLVPILFLVLLVRGFVSLFSSNGRRASTGWASGSSWSNDSSWSSSSSDSSWSSGGGGDSGFTGGGGDFGGGGGGDSF
jgi:uncharacterized protein